jgi:predicted RNase H-like nuclease (RuvC/YqgF family)
LAWCKQVTDGYKGVNIRDFKNSFADGNAFLALVHAYDKKLFNYEHQLEEHSTIENIEHAFNTAEKVLGIPQLLDAQELLDGTVDERSIVLYVSLYFHAYVSAQEKNKIEGEKKAITEKVTDLETQLLEMKEENEVLTKKLSNSDEELKSLKSKYEEKEKALDKLHQEKESVDRELEDLRSQFKKLKEKTEERSQVETKGSF